LDDARSIAGVPFVLTSAFRAGDPRSHGRGLAVDIRCSDSETRWRILKGVILAGFLRIGIYDRHIHVDIDESLPQRVAWWGRSQ
jgi:hypothetical protein